MKTKFLLKFTFFMQIVFSFNSCYAQEEAHFARYFMSHAKNKHQQAIWERVFLNKPTISEMNEIDKKISPIDNPHWALAFLPLYEENEENNEYYLERISHIQSHYQFNIYLLYFHHGNLEEKLSMFYHIDRLKTKEQYAILSHFFEKNNRLMDLKQLLAQENKYQLLYVLQSMKTFIGMPEFDPLFNLKDFSQTILLEEKGVACQKITHSPISYLDCLREIHPFKNNPLISFEGFLNGSIFSQEYMELYIGIKDKNIQESINRYTNKAGLKTLKLPDNLIIVLNNNTKWSTNNSNLFKFVEIPIFNFDGLKVGSQKYRLKNWMSKDWSVFDIKNNRCYPIEVDTKTPELHQQPLLLQYEKLRTHVKKDKVKWLTRN